MSLHDQSNLIALARSVALPRSHDHDTHVGVVIARQGAILTVQTNSLSTGLPVTDDRVQRPGKYIWMQHAEQAAIADCARTGAATQGAEVYLWASRPFFPCASCASLLTRAGVSWLVVSPLLADLDQESDKYQFQEANTILAYGGVAVIKHEERPHA